MSITSSRTKLLMTSLKITTRWLVRLSGWKMQSIGTGKLLMEGEWHKMQMRVSWRLSMRQKYRQVLNREKFDNKFINKSLYKNMLKNKSSRKIQMRIKATSNQLKLKRNIRQKMETMLKMFRLGHPTRRSNLKVLRKKRKRRKKWILWMLKLKSSLNRRNNLKRWAENQYYLH